jgi:transposase, IS5 family
MLPIMARMVRQPREDNSQVYSLHAPETSCIAKGTVHQQYALGRKVSIASVLGSHVVVRVVHLAQ